MGLKAAVRSLQEIAETARHELMLCALALDDAEPPPPDLLGLHRAVTAPLRFVRLKQAQRHRTIAKRHINRLHATLHERAFLGVRNGELWSAIMRGVDALSLSRWLTADALTPADLAPARATVHILLGDLADLLGMLGELEWPGEAQ